MFRFYLNNNLLSDENLDWSDARYGIKRSSIYNALFFEYVTNLQFQGDGYQYIVSQIQSGYCDKMDVRIEYSCDGQNFELFFTGIIRLRDIEHDEFNCIITCDVEDDTLWATILDLIDVEVALDDTRSKVGVTVVPPPLVNRFLRDSSGSGSLLRPGYFVFDVFQFLLNHMTDNTVTFASNLLTTNPTRGSNTIKFTNTAQLTGVGGLIITYTNYFGVQNAISIGLNNNTVQQVLDNICFASRFDLTALDPIDEYYQNDFNKWATSSNDGVDTVTFVSDLPFTIDSVVSTSFPISSIIDNSGNIPVDGLNKLSMFSGLQLRGASVNNLGVPVISFKSLFDEINKHKNLGMVITNIGGNITLRIDPISSFFQNNGTVLLDQVPFLKYTISDKFNKDYVKVGDDSYGQEYGGQINLPVEWLTGGIYCQSVKQDCHNKYISDWNMIYNQRTTTTDKYDEKIFLIECEQPNVNIISRTYTDTTYTSNSPLTPLNGNVYNVHLNNYWKIRSWLFSCTGDARLGTKLITNDSLPKPQKAYNFDYPLTYTQIKALKNNNEDFITFRGSDNPIDNKDGWIEDVEWNLNDGNATLTLITQ